MIVYVSIGNSDDKLTQREWHEFILAVDAALTASSATCVHGLWFSAPVAPWQNACWCIEFGTDVHAERARLAVAEIRARYRQDSAAWAVAETEMV